MYSPIVTIIGDSLSIIVGNNVRLLSTFSEVIKALGLRITSPYSQQGAYVYEWNFTFLGDIHVRVYALFEQHSQAYAYYRGQLISKVTLDVYDEDIESIITNNYAQLSEWLFEVNEIQADIVATASEMSFYQQ